MGAGDTEGAIEGTQCFSKDGVDVAVGVRVGVCWADDAIEIAGDGW